MAMLENFALIKTKIPASILYTLYLDKPLATMHYQQASCQRVYKKTIINNTGWKPCDMVS